MVKTKNGAWVFLINDVLVLKGKYLLDVNVVKRLNMLYEVLKTDFIQDDMDICHMAIKKYFKYDQLSDLIDNHIPRLPYTCRGLYFKPLFLRFREILVNFDDSVVKKVERVKYKNTSNFMLNQNYTKFYVRKTSNPDIYELFDIHTQKPEGMACIPSMKVSKAMRLIFQDKNVVDKIELPCEFSTKFNKWIPVVE